MTAGVNNQEEELKVTSADEWESAVPAQGFVVKLPTGRVIRMRRTMDLVMLLKQGRIPNPLASIVREMIDRKEVDPSKFDALDAEGQLAMVRMIDNCVCGAVVEPKIQQRPQDLPPEKDWKPDPGCIDIEVVDLDDRMFIYTVAQGGATDLGQFRSLEGVALAHVSDEQGVAPAPKPNRRTTARKPK